MNLTCFHSSNVNINKDNLILNNKINKDISFHFHAGNFYSSLEAGLRKSIENNVNFVYVHKINLVNINEENIYYINEDFGSVEEWDNLIENIKKKDVENIIKIIEYKNKYELGFSNSYILLEEIKSNINKIESIKLDINDIEKMLDVIYNNDIENIMDSKEIDIWFNKIKNNSLRKNRYKL